MAAAIQVVNQQPEKVRRECLPPQGHLELSTHWLTAGRFATARVPAAERPRRDAACSAGPGLVFLLCSERSALTSAYRRSHVCVTRMRLETKFLRLKTPVTLGSRFGDWQ